jgi:hypothetical protein
MYLLGFLEVPPGRFWPMLPVVMGKAEYRWQRFHSD